MPVCPTEPLLRTVPVENANFAEQVKACMTIFDKEV